MPIADRQRGFTLIELLIVIIVVGILMAIAVPMYLGQRARAKDASVKEGAHTVLVAVLSYAVDTQDALPDQTLGTLQSQVMPQIQLWPDNPFANPVAPMTNWPLLASVTTGNLVYTHATGTSAFTLGGMVRDGSIFWVHQ